MGENDRRISLLRRLLQHAETTARFNVYFGKGRDEYDVRGRVAHESLFNVNDGSYRCPSTQQGYSPFTTWTRGLAWILCGYAEQLEFLNALPESDFNGLGDRDRILRRFLEVARATADFYLKHSPTDGVPYWDTGAPGLAKLEGYLDRPADPFNDREPVDSSAAAIAAQGLIRLGRYLSLGKQKAEGSRYLAAGLYSENPTYQYRRATRASCCTRSTTAQTGGIMCPRGARSPAASPPCGATITLANWACFSSG